MFIEIVEMMQCNAHKSPCSKRIIDSYRQILTWTWWRRIGATGMIIIRRWCLYCWRLWNAYSKQCIKLLMFLSVYHRSECLRLIPNNAAGEHKLCYTLPEMVSGPISDTVRKRVG